jgi:hypothetical protein
MVFLWELGISCRGKSQPSMNMPLTNDLVRVSISNNTKFHLFKYPFYEWLIPSMWSLSTQYKLTIAHIKCIRLRGVFVINIAALRCSCFLCC